MTNERSGDPGRPGRALSATQQRAATRALATALQFTELSRDQVELGYLTLGGNHPQRVGAYLRGEHTLTGYEYNVLAQVFNDAFIDHSQDHPVPSAEQLPTDTLSG